MEYPYPTHWTGPRKAYIPIYSIFQNMFHIFQLLDLQLCSGNVCTSTDWWTPAPVECRWSSSFPLFSGLCYEDPSKSCLRGFCGTDILFEFCRGLSTECLVQFQVNENLHRSTRGSKPFQQKVVVTATHDMLFSTPNFSLPHAPGNV